MTVLFIIELLNYYNTFLYCYTYHETTIGKSGVKMLCVIKNHITPSATPINAPQNTWVFE